MLSRLSLQWTTWAITAPVELAREADVIFSFPWCVPWPIVLALPTLTFA